MSLVAKEVISGKIFRQIHKAAFCSLAVKVRFSGMNRGSVKQLQEFLGYSVMSFLEIIGQQ